MARRFSRAETLFSERGPSSRTPFRLLNRPAKEPYWINTLHDPGVRNVIRLKPGFWHGLQGILEWNLCLNAN